MCDSLDVARHTCHCPSDPISFDICHSCLVLSGTSSVITTGIVAGRNQEVGLWDH